MKDKNSVRPLFVIFVLLIAAISALGWGYFLSEQHRVRHDAETSLGAIADLKASQLADWKRERLADANVLMADHAALRELARVIDGEEVAPREGVEHWLEALCLHYGYETALVLDRAGETRMTIGHTDVHLGERMPELIANCLAQAKPVFSEMHRTAPTADPHIGLLIPLSIPGGAGNPDPFGLLVLRIDPADFLFPLIQTWPTPSRTAETLLVRRDGDDVLFLNELRHQSGTAMTLKIPVSRNELPAARAVQGFSGSVRGLDYRGVPVLAAVRAVPESRWYMISKVDVAEVDAPLKRVGPPILVCVLALIAACGAGLGALWRKQAQQWLERQVQIESDRGEVQAELRRAQERFRTYFEESLMGMAITSPEKGWLQANKRLCDMLGYTFDELRQTTWPELTHPEDLSADAAQFERLLVGEIDGYSLDKRFIRKDGSVVPTILSVRAVHRSDGNVDYVLAQLQDITVHNLAREKAEQERQFSDSVISSLPGVFYVIGAEGRFRRWNTNFETVTGYSHDEMSTLSSLDLFTGEDKPLIAERIQKTFESGAAQAEAELVTKSGASLAYLFTGVRVELGGEPLLVGMGLDISDRNRAMADLEASEARFRTLLTLAPLPLAHVDKAGDLVFINQCFQDLFGYDLNDVPNLDAWWLAAYPDPDYRTWVQETWDADVERAARAGTDIASREYELTCKDGTVRYVEIGGVVIDEEFLATFVDRTEQRKAVVALAENERRYRGIFDTAPVSIWDEDWSGVIAMMEGLPREADGDVPAYLATHPDFVEQALKEVRIVDVNAETMSMFGAVDKEQLLASLETVFATPDTLSGFVGELCALAAGEQFYKTEMRLCTVQGDRIHVLLTMAFPEAGDDSGTVLVSLMDLTERKQHEEAQARLTEELARKNRELAQVIYVASHDLRSPLVNVQGFSRELKATLEDVRTALTDQSLPDETAQQVGVLLEVDIPESLDFILNSVSQMDRLLSGLLAISRLGRAAQTMTELDMGVLVSGVVDTLDFQIREKDGSVVIDPLPACRGDAGQMEQVFQNLIGNAVKYAAPDRPLVITISGEQRNGEAVYCVTDNGRGIAPEHQEKVFELFHRLAPGESQGDGLGLTTVRTVMDRHGGRVWLESVPGEGSRFYVAVPIHDGDERAWRENRASTTKNEREAETT